MREINFRIFDKISKKIRPVWSLHTETDQEGEFCVEVPGKSVVSMEGDHDCEIDVLRGHNFILMQFTGLHDKNGKEIFEGDVVRVKCNGELNDKIVSIIFEDAAFRDSYYKWQLLRKSDSCYEVLGNIYENPELLKDTP